MWCGASDRGVDFRKVGFQPVVTCKRLLAARQVAVAVGRAERQPEHESLQSRRHEGKLAGLRKVANLLEAVELHPAFLMGADNAAELRAANSDAKEDKSDKARRILMENQVRMVFGKRDRKAGFLMDLADRRAPGSSCSANGATTV